MKDLLQRFKHKRKPVKNICLQEKVMINFSIIDDIGGASIILKD